MRRIATQKAQGCCQEIRVATEVRPIDAPDRAVGSVGNSLRALNPTVGGPMPSRTVLSTSCGGQVASATGIFKGGIGPIRPRRITPAPRQAFRPRTVSHHRLRVRLEEAGVGRSSRTRGMVLACPARCLRWSPNVQMPAPLGISARSSPALITLIAVTRALLSWRRFSHEGARRSHVAVQVWPWLETLGPNSQRPDRPSPELRPGVWLHGARTTEPFRDRRRVCRDDFLCSRSWHA
jgi:hypothetical protein